MNLTSIYNENQLKALVYDNRFKIGENLLRLINDNGYTKSSFAKFTGISRPTLDKLIKSEVDNNTTLKTHVDKILNVFNISLEELLNLTNEETLNSEVMIASNNAPDNHEISESAKRVFSIINDIVGLCEVYCDR